MATEVIYQIEIISDEFWDIEGWENKGPGACFKTREGVVAWAEEYLAEFKDEWDFDPDMTLEQFAEIVECPLHDTV